MNHDLTVNNDKSRKPGAGTHHLVSDPVFRPSQFKSTSQNRSLQLPYGTNSFASKIEGKKKEKFVVGWKIASPSANIASVRYRAILPILALEDFGVICKVFSTAKIKNLNSLNALVIVKSFQLEDFCLAQEASLRGIPVIVDICDNIFIDTYKSKSNLSPAEVFLMIAQISSAVVTPTEPLAEVVREALDGRVHVHVIPDGIEFDTLLSQGCQILDSIRRREALDYIVGKLRQKILLNRGIELFRTGSISKAIRYWASPTFTRGSLRLKKYCHWRFWAKEAYWYFETVRAYLLRRPSKLTSADEIKDTPVVSGYETLSARENVRRILWFGNHGAPHARFGMLDLLEIRNALEQIAKEFTVELVVVSNNSAKYRQHIQPLAIPSRYVEWSVDSIKRHLEVADVVVIPNTLDPFSVCKSANRTVLALARGIPVVATATPALKPLQHCIETGDFYEGLRHYLTDPDHVQKHVKLGQRLITRHYGQQAIASAWTEVLRAVTNLEQYRSVTAPNLLVALNLIQDLDLALPIIKLAMRRGISLEVWCSVPLLNKSPRVSAALKELKVPWRPMPDDPRVLQYSYFPHSVRVLLTVAETNLGPHRFTRELTLLAQQASIFTVTLQHGFENVGLSYSDEIHAIQKIKIASDRIYTWGPPETLHPKIPKRTRSKCLPVGCPKPATSEPANLGDLIPSGSPVVGVFENLHWHRYSQSYREFFLSSIYRLATKFPELIFLTKPHHAGMWLTGRHQGEKPCLDNLVIADPQNLVWERYTATHLMGHLNAVITTPSTVALDAARAGLPTALVTSDLLLENYAPLFRIAKDEDWEVFIQSTLNPSDRTALVDTSRRFVERVLVPGDGAERIVDDISSIITLGRANNA